MENQENQNNQTTEQKKGIFEQFKGMSFGGYLCICAILKAIVEIIKVVFKSKK